MSLWLNFRRTVKTPLARVGLGLFTLGTAGVGLWPTAGAEFDPEKFLAFVAALGVWLFAELFPEESVDRPHHHAELSKHDRQLAHLITKHATDGFVLFLERHDFGASWLKEWTAPLYELLYLFENPTTEFDDEDLQAKLKKVEDATTQVARKIGQWGGPINGADLFSMIPTREKDLDDWSESTRERVRETNSSADQLALDIRELLRLFRKKGVELLAPVAVSESSDKAVVQSDR